MCFVSLTVKGNSHNIISMTLEWGLVLAISLNTNSDINLLIHWIHYVLALWKLSLHFIFFLSCQNYTTLHRALMTDLKNINNDIMSLNESDLLHVILYRNKNFDNMNISICNYQVYQRHWKIWSTSLLTIIKTILINSSIPLSIFFQEVCCITTMIFFLP